MDLIELKHNKSIQNHQRHPWEKARLKIIESTLLKTLKDTNKDYIFLDVGSGDTFIAEHLEKTYSNSSFFCVDTAFTDEHISTFKAKYSNTNIKIFKHLKDASKSINTEISFILLLDVLEHIKDDINFLKTLNELNNFKTSSFLFITVPAFQFLFTQHDVILGHFRRYTNKSLEQVTKDAKFSTVKKGYFFFSLLIPRSISKFSEKLRLTKQKKTQVSNWSQGQVITNFFTKILLLDYYISKLIERIGVKPIGLSNYIICKKNA